MENKVSDKVAGKAAILWEWVPNERIGPIVFGNPVSDYVDALSLRLESNEADAGYEEDYYTVPGADVDIHFENGVVEQISIGDEFVFSGKNVIGAEESKLKSLLGSEPDEINEVELGEDGDPHQVLAYPALGLQVWLYHGIVDQIGCWRDEGDEEEDVSAEG